MRVIRSAASSSWDNCSKLACDNVPSCVFQASEGTVSNSEIDQFLRHLNVDILLLLFFKLCIVSFMYSSLMPMVFTMRLMQSRAQHNQAEAFEHADAREAAP